MTNEQTNVTVKYWNLHKMENLEISSGHFEIRLNIICYVSILEMNNFIFGIKKN